MEAVAELRVTVVTTPAGVILLMALFPESATNIFPEESIVASVGLLNLAAVPIPS